MELITQVVEHIKQNPKLVAVDDYEICVALNQARYKRYTNGELDESGSAHGLWISLRLLHRKQPGRAFVTSSNKNVLAKLVEDAYTSSERSEVDPWFRFPIWRQLPAQHAVAPIGALEDFESSLFQEISAPPAMLFESYKTNEECVGIGRKREKQFLLRKNRFQEVKFSLAEEGKEGPVRLSSERAKTKIQQEKKEWLGEDLGTLAVQKDAEKIKGKIRGPFIFGPRVMVQVLKQIQDWFLADKVQASLSPMKDIDENKLLFSSCLTLVDDGNLSEGAYSVPFDMEGVASQKTTLVENGRFKNFLYDTYAGTRENRLSTGNFFHSQDKGFPGLAATSLYFQRGQNPFLVKELEEGFYFDAIDMVDRVDSMQLSGTFRGWKVSKGGLSYPVCGVTLSVEILPLLKSAVSASQEIQFFGRFGSPSILFEKMP